VNSREERSGRAEVNRSSPEGWLCGFDYVRAFFVVAIVAGHCGIFKVIVEFPLLHYASFHYTFLLGVPVFYQLSLYLYVRRASAEPDYFRKRVGKLLVIFLFWWPINLLLTGQPDSLYKFLVVEREPLISILMGNHTLMYFVLGLIIYVILCEILIRLNVHRRAFGVQLLLIIGSCGVMVIGQETFHKIFGFYLGYANPLNFLPYVFTSLALVNIGRNSSRHLNALGVCLGLIFLSFAIAEYGLHSRYAVFWRYTYFEYARVSLVAASALVVISFARLDVTPPRWVIHLSDLSLGIYVTHSITMFVVIKVSESFGMTVNVFALFAATLSLSLAASAAIKYRAAQII